MNPFTWLRSLYDWTMRMAAHPHAMWWLALIAFCESSFFPIPQDLMMIPMILAARERAFRIALVATIASVAGGMAGYAIGAGLYETVGQPIIAFYGYAEKYAVFQGWYHEWGAWIVAAGAFTPIPFKVITIASGAAEMDFSTFAIISAVGRGARFFIIAALLWHFGAPIRRLIEERFGLMSALFFALLIGGFAALKFAG
ncbi:YqaA family protein [Aestuariispira ectoiniformans]|uniref:YqaA family protein n=1 Tax=Aestuariispira ectoiniformans TaxID=2775080 RepID=UPI00223A6FEC|nr:YqaA family protein [Aestuariispira ectoiniformans]